MYDQAPFDVTCDFAPITMLIEQPYIVSVRPAVAATVLTLGTSSMFRWIDAKLPARFYRASRRTFAQRVANGRNRVPATGQRSRLFDCQSQLSHAQRRGYFEYRMVTWTHNQNNTQRKRSPNSAWLPGSVFHRRAINAACRKLLGAFNENPDAGEFACIGVADFRFD